MSERAGGITKKPHKVQMIVQHLKKCFVSFINERMNQREWERAHSEFYKQLHPIIMPAMELNLVFISSPLNVLYYRLSVKIILITKFIFSVLSYKWNYTAQPGVKWKDVKPQKSERASNLGKQDLFHLYSCRLCLFTCARCSSISHKVMYYIIWNINEQNC